MADTPSLGSLPAELKALIVRACRDRDLLRLRVAVIGDLDLTAGANKEFGTRFMQRRIHYVTLDGLQALVDITGHAVFGR